MQNNPLQVKVFISYSWSTAEHEAWVLNLAERLYSDGIIAVLDKWDLKEGQDKHSFMEQMVSDSTITKVLVICDAVYETKANSRKGGVGTESQLISKEVYENTSQEKFIPIVKEYKGGNPCVPHYMASRIYIDLSADDKYEDGYQKLVRNIYNKPELKRPVLGIAPSYITEDDPIILKTSHKVQEIKNALLNGKPIANGLIGDYYDLFITSLEDFRFTGNASITGYDEEIVKLISQMQPLRDDFIEFLFILLKYKENFEIEDLKDFFEKLIPLQYSQGLGSYSAVHFDNYKFFCYELMLYIIAILLKLKKYEQASFFIYTQYYFKKGNQSELQFSNIEEFNNYSTSLEEHRKRRLQLNRISITADLIKSRAIRKDISFEEIMNADLILYYLLSLKDGQVRFGWFPRTAAYLEWGEGIIDIFAKQISAAYFEKTKCLYEVSSKEELKMKVDKYKNDIAENRKQRISGWDFNIRALETVIDVEKIGIMR